MIVFVGLVGMLLNVPNSDDAKGGLAFQRLFGLYFSVLNDLRFQSASTALGAAGAPRPRSQSVPRELSNGTSNERAAPSLLPRSLSLSLSHFGTHDEWVHFFGRRQLCSASALPWDLPFVMSAKFSFLLSDTYV